MTQRRTEQVPMPDGSELRLTVVEPDPAHRSGVIRGGIVVVHEARGVTDAVRNLAEGLAAEGWLVVVPHLYHRDGADELPADGDRDQLRDQVQRLSADSVLADTDASFRWLAGRQVSADRMGVVGFGLGGSIALIVAARRDLGAAVSVAAGGIITPLSDTLPPLVEAAVELRCPWLGIFGADRQVPEEEVHKLRDAAACADVATDLVYFPADDHRFDDDQAGIREAWMRTLNWFDSHMR
ncbi:MAG: carboxymethylenebutenolidase [Pseudonocardiaceae bacterium]|nr:carboxymethylenebutenolidase [Pseudonocardiaceae bacterium]